MAQDFYPFVENGAQSAGPQESEVRHPARIAVYDDAAAAPRVVIVEPKDVRAYLEEITLQVTQLAQGQGGSIPFMVIREIVENFIHAYFMEPTISILDHGNTIRFSDQGPGIQEKERALQYGTTSATEEMRRYIRGVGSGLPYAQQYMIDKGGSLRIDDNISGGTVVTISMDSPQTSVGAPPIPFPQVDATMQSLWQGQAGMQGAQPYAPVQPYATQGAPWPQQQGWSQTPAWPAWPQQQGWPAQQMPQPYAGQAQPFPGNVGGGGFAAPAMSPGATGGAVAGQAPGTQQGPSPEMPQPQGSPFGWMELSARGRLVLDYLSSHESVGPTELQRVYGDSQPTWTRELKALEAAGLILKEGQKRRLTSMGAAFISQS